MRAHLLDRGQGAEDIGVTSVQDGQDTNTEVTTAGSSQRVVIAMEVMDIDLSQHSVVLNFVSAERRAIVGKDDEFGLSVSQSLDTTSETKRVLTTLDHQPEGGVDRLRRVLVSVLHHD